MKHFTLGTSRSLLLLAICAVAAIAAGCSHTNHLARYHLRGKPALFRSFASGGGSSSVSISNPTDSWIGDIAAIAGSIALSAEAQKKLDRAINADSLAANLSVGIRQAAMDYFELRPPINSSETPEYLVETTLTDYAIHSSSEGVAARIEGESRIVHIPTGEVVWDNWETTVIPLWGSSSGSDKREADAASSGSNAVGLFNLEEEEIRRILNDGAMAVGRYLGDELREDLAEMYEEED
ncbi:MAG: hypothetical protein IPM61_11505 [Chlorobi bacterium]|nr:MAG: hypothetical protein UZ07_CHB004002650 [Chlorobi bacterium OLB7]MBK8911941.1 hypothetical protein [Chlorobiota bacterium]